MKGRLFAGLATLIACSSVVYGTSFPSFQGLGDLPGGSFASSATDVSADGSVVVGESSTGAGYGPASRSTFYWTRATGMVSLGNYSGPGGVSGNGSVVVGRTYGAAHNSFPSIWTAATGWFMVGGYGCATGASHDGSVMVGASGSAGGPLQAFRWTSSTGSVAIGSGDSYASDVSADGCVVVGYTLSEGAFRWTSETGIVMLGASWAGAVSADGSIVVGHRAAAVGDEAFLWTEADGITGLGYPHDGYSYTYASDVSADASIVVGYGRPYCCPPFEALIWDATHGMRILRDALVDEYGLDLTGWTLSEVAAISDDGLTIVGTGINPDGNGEAWIAVIPEPSSAMLLLIGLAWLALHRGLKKIFSAFAREIFVFLTAWDKLQSNMFSTG